MLAPRALWLMPVGDLHLSVLEVAHHQTPEAVEELVKRLEPALPGVLAFARGQGWGQERPRPRVRLFRPRLACDPVSIVLKFLPATSDDGYDGDEQERGYTYHHLRRDLYARVSALGVRMEPRYVVPSAHLTVARFVRAG